MTDEDNRRNLNLPDRRKNTYEELEKRLDEHVEDIQQRLRGFFTKALVAFAVIGLISSGSLLGFGMVLSDQKNTAVDIQQQRFDSVVSSCREQNKRNLNVSKEIDRAIAAIPGKKRREKAEKNSVPFRLIIGAAVPFRSDCIGYAHERVKDTN